MCIDDKPGAVRDELLRLLDEKVQTRINAVRPGWKISKQVAVKPRSKGNEYMAFSIPPDFKAVKSERNATCGLLSETLDRFVGEGGWFSRLPLSFRKAFHKNYREGIEKKERAIVVAADSSLDTEAGQSLGGSTEDPRTRSNLDSYNELGSDNDVSHPQGTPRRGLKFLLRSEEGPRSRKTE